MQSTASLEMTRRRRVSGFTLVEMLVVIGIILLLASILMPAIQNFYNRADRLRTRDDLMAIGQALDAYAHDFNGVYPIDAANHDHALLSKALLGPTPGSGFKMGAGTGSGKTFGPYMNLEHVKLGNETSTTSNVARIMDRYGRAIQYYPRYSTNPKYLMGPISQATFLYHASDGEADSLGIKIMLGDDNQNNQIDPANVPPEKLRYGGAYLLISAGPDKVFFTAPTTGLASSAADRTDDIYYPLER
jgi:prepilin-type N-terminal cleavage/methylation domain-containing protein